MKMQISNSGTPFNDQFSQTSDVEVIAMLPQHLRVPAQALLNFSSPMEQPSAVKSIVDAQLFGDEARALETIKARFRTRYEANVASFESAGIVDEARGLYAGIL